MSSISRAISKTASVTRLALSLFHTRFRRAVPRHTFRRLIRLYRSGAAPTEVRRQHRSRSLFRFDLDQNTLGISNTIIQRCVLEIDSFILIGGRSSRFGADKRFAKLEGRTLAERALDAVRKGLPESRITMVAGTPAEFGIQAIVAGVPFIHDLYENRGPLGGLHAALAYARTEWIFLLACDYPFVTAELIELLEGKISDR